MRKILLSTFLLFVCISLFSQQTVYWRSEAVNANWANENDNNWNRTNDTWDVRRPDLDFNEWSADGTKSYNIIRFANAHQLTTTVNGNIGETKYHVYRLEMRNSSSRTFNSSDDGYFALGGGTENAKVEAISGEGTGNYTFNVPMTYEKITELNPVGGNLTFNSLIDNGGFWTDVWGGVDKSLTISGGLSGTGGLAVKNNTLVIISNDALYEGGTAVEAGTLELQGSLASSSVTVQDGATLRINGTDVTVASLTVESGGVVEIEPGMVLTVTGALANSAGNAGLVIKSGAGGTGSLIHNTADIDATVERYFAGEETWRLVSSPVAAQAISGVWTPAGSYTGGHGYDFYAYDEENELWLNQLVEDNNITQFEPGVGYLVSFETENQTKEFGGDLNTGNIPVTVTRKSAGDFAGVNLLGNPYPSSIDWNDADRSLFEDDFAYVYDASGNGGSGEYVSVNGGSADAFIAPHQGFFVIVDDASGETNTFTFTNAMRSHGGTFYKNQEVEENESIVLRLSNNDYYDQTTLRVLENSAFERDRQDARKFFSYNQSAPQIYSLTADEVQVSINSIPAINEEATTQLGMRIPADGTYEITISELTGVFAEQVIYMEDLHLAVQHNLSENGNYSFAAEAGDLNNRFLIHFGALSLDESSTQTAANAYVHNSMLYVLNASGQTQVDIIDLQGRTLQSSSFRADVLHSQTLSQLPGVYVVRIADEKGVRTAKVVVE